MIPAERLERLDLLLAGGRQAQGPTVPLEILKTVAGGVAWLMACAASLLFAAKAFEAITARRVRGHEPFAEPVLELPRKAA